MNPTIPSGWVGGVSGGGRLRKLTRSGRGGVQVSAALYGGVRRSRRGGGAEAALYYG